MPETSSTSGPSMSENLVVLFATLFVLEANSRLPSASFLVIMLGGTAMIGPGLAYLTRIAIQFARPKADYSKYFKLRSIAKWAVLPAAIALLISSDATHWPAAVRFHFSKSSFQHIVTQGQKGIRPAGFPRRVGWYWIESISDYSFDYRGGQGKLGFVTGTALIDPCGINYDPADPPTSNWLTTRLAPCWYLTEW
ncbi:MAG: hypothetical protein JWN70_2896 [Planctomycetaceae bacterium]|nr:hypothetical protein [Planctomycetaceae bacterium]